MFDLFTNVIKAGVESVGDTVSSAFDFLDGLTEGEIREKALLRFGAGAIEGLSITEIMRKLAED